MTISVAPASVHMYCYRKIKITPTHVGGYCCRWIYILIELDESVTPGRLHDIIGNLKGNVLFD